MPGAGSAVTASLLKPCASTATLPQSISATPMFARRPSRCGAARRRPPAANEPQAIQVPTSEELHTTAACPLATDDLSLALYSRFRPLALVWSTSGGGGVVIRGCTRRHGRKYADATPKQGQSKAARALLNWTQADLAERSGVKLSARGLPLFGSRRRGLECASKKPFASPNSISCSAKLAKAKCHNCGINSRTWKLAR